MTSTSKAFTSGQVLTAAQMNEMPQGIIAHATPITSNVGPTSGTTELDVITAPAVTLASATRRLKITFSWRSITATVANDVFSLRIKEGGTQFTESNQQLQSTSVGHVGGTLVAIVSSPTAASHTYKATIVRSLGTGTGTITGAATTPITLEVEDVGEV